LEEREKPKQVAEVTVATARIDAEHRSFSCIHQVRTNCSGENEPYATFWLSSFQVHRHIKLIDVDTRVLSCVYRQ